MVDAVRRESSLRSAICGGRLAGFAGEERRRGVGGGCRRGAGSPSSESAAIRSWRQCAVPACRAGSANRRTGVARSRRKRACPAAPIRRSGPQSAEPRRGQTSRAAGHLSFTRRFRARSMRYPVGFGLVPVVHSTIPRPLEAVCGGIRRKRSPAAAPTRRCRPDSAHSCGGSACLSGGSSAPQPPSARRAGGTP